jgi:hypothetical protein
MSQALTTTEPVSAQALEHVLGTGDLSKLTTQQRVEYLVATCKSLGLNPLTRPIRFLSLNGQIQIYFTRDGTDQLRSSRNITLHVVDKSIDAGVFSVTVRARTKDGREDEDIGAVVLPASGDSRANALMKAITKAKRRVTLSICGLGQTDESELDTMPGARVFDAEDDVPVAPIRTARDALNDTIPLRPAAAATPRAERKVDPTPYEAGPPASDRKSWAQWAQSLELADRDSKDTAEIGRIIAKSEIAEIVRLAQEGEPSPAKTRIVAAFRNLEARYLADPPQPPDADDLDEVVIAGEANLAAG